MSHPPIIGALSALHVAMIVDIADRERQIVLVGPSPAITLTEALADEPVTLRLDDLRPVELPLSEYIGTDAPDLMPPLPMWHPASLKRVGSRTPAVGAEAAKRAARKREKAARKRQRGQR